MPARYNLINKHLINKYLILPMRINEQEIVFSYNNGQRFRKSSLIRAIYLSDRLSTTNWRIEQIISQKLDETKGGQKV